MNAALQELEPRLKRLGAALGQNRPDLVDELTQVARVAAWQALARYREGTEVPRDTFAVVAARYACLDVLRANAREAARHVAELPELAGDGATLEDLLGGIQEFEAHVRTLPPREALVMRGTVLGYSAREMAPLLDVSPDHVRQIRLDAASTLVAARRRVEPRNARVITRRRKPCRAQ